MEPQSCGAVATGELSHAAVQDRSVSHERFGSFYEPTAGRISVQRQSGQDERKSRMIFPPSENKWQRSNYESESRQFVDKTVSLGSRLLVVYRAVVTKRNGECRRAGRDSNRDAGAGAEFS